MQLHNCGGRGEGYKVVDGGGKRQESNGGALVHCVEGVDCSGVRLQPRHTAKEEEKRGGKWI